MSRLRGLLKHPGYSAAAILSLALGIGANTAIFSVMNALFLRPFPYADAERLAILWNRSPGLNITEDWFSTAQYFDIKQSQGGFEQVAIAIGGNQTLTGGNGEPERVGAIRMSSNLLPALGVKPALGRLFTAEEDTPGRSPVALLSHGMWTRRYGADPGIVGRKIIINGQPFEVAGVLPRGFSLPREVMPTLGGADDAEIVLPLPLPAAAASDRDHEDYNIIGKLKRGVSMQQAQAEMDALTARLRRDFPATYPPNGGLTFSIVPLRQQVAGDIRRAIFVLAAAVGFVLLIACANVANLSLSRALARSRELAVRAALGAGRGRIMRDMLAESLILGMVGGVAGVVLCAWMLQWVRAFGARSVPRSSEIAIDVSVLLFTLAVSLGAGALFGILPALRGSRVDLTESLNSSSRGSSSVGSLWKRGNHLRRALVVAELALSVVLLIGAGLLIRSFNALQNVNPGFQSDHVLTFGLTLAGRQYQNPAVVLELYRRLWERTERLPGVVAAGGITALPLDNAFAWGPITVEGRTPPPGENFINADIRTVGGRYFEAMGIPLLRGRFFTAHDTTEQPRVVIVDEFMAQQLWPNQDCIGKRIRYGGLDAATPWMTVAGVVGRVKQYTLDADSRIALYRPQTQSPARGLSVTIRTTGDPAVLTAAVKQEIRALDADLPIYRVRTMRERVDESLARRRFSMTLLACFAGLALLLAIVGTYGVMSYLVSQGTREIGIRMALGATEAGVARVVVLRGVGLAAMGTGIGLAAAALLTRLMESLLYNVTARDVSTFAGVAAVLLAVASLACYLPARRAARVQPAEALRWE